MLFEAWQQSCLTGCAPAALVAAWPSFAVCGESTAQYWRAWEKLCVCGGGSGGDGRWARGASVLPVRLCVLCVCMWVGGPGPKPIK